MYEVMRQTGVLVKTLQNTNQTTRAPSNWSLGVLEKYLIQWVCKSVYVFFTIDVLFKFYVGDDICSVIQ